MTFVDTSAWFALHVPDDEHHRHSRAWLDAHQEEALVTTDYVVSELLTLLRFRREHRRAIEVGHELLGDPAIGIEWTTRADFLSAWGVFTRFHDKGWSFVDCTSRVVMERLGVTSAAFDEHFRQFATVQVVP